MNTIFKKTLTAAAAALTLGFAIAASSAPAEARWNRGGAFAAGAAIGLLGAAATAHAYNAPRHGYAYHGGECWREKREVYNRYGDFAGYRSIRVCN